MTANARAAWAFHARKLFRQRTALALTACFAAMPIGIGATGAQAKVVADPFASAASAQRVLASELRGLDSTRRELREAKQSLKHAESVLLGCHRSDQPRCVAARRAVRNASARSKRLHRRLEGTVAKVSQAQISRRAPTLSASGGTLQWTPVNHVADYVLESKPTGSSAHYQVVKGRSETPASAPGTTVSYRVRTNIADSRWSAPVALRHQSESGAVEVVSASSGTGGKHGQAPAEGEGSSTSKSSPKEAPVNKEAPAKEAPAKEREPPISEESVKESSGAGSSTFEPGLDSGTNLELDVQGAEKLKAKLARIEFPVGDTPNQMEPVIAAYANAGIRVLPLAGFSGSMPTTSQARGLAAWASAFGPGGSFWAGRSDGDLAIQDIEFGNETSYGYQYNDNAGEPSYQARARTYAVRVKEAAEAIDGTSHHVGVLAQEDDWTGDWANGMFEAVPNLGSYVAGWTIHPYGPEWEGRIKDLVNQTTSHGAPASIPIDITEWGISTDNGKCLTENYEWNPCMTYEEAGSALTSSISAMHRVLGSRLGIFILYQVRDQAPSAASTNEREAYFGALQHELQPKGAFTTAVERVLAEK